jgi:hypothetical protein
MEAEMIRDRTSEGKRVAREMGRWPGGQIAYGYRVNGSSELVADETERAILRNAAQLVLNGGSIASAVRYMEDSSLRPRAATHRVKPSEKAAHWTRHTVKRALTGKHAAEVLGFELAEGVREAIGDAGEQSSTNPTRLLSGIAKCSSCGSAMHASNTVPMADGTRHAAYRCSLRNNGGRCPEARVITSQPLDDWIESRYLDLHGDRERTVVVRASDDRSRKLAELTARERELEAVSLDRKQPFDARRDAFDNLGRVRTEIEEVKARRSTRLATVRGTGETIRAYWERADLDERRVIIRRFVGPSGLIIGKGRRGIKGSQLAERVLNRERFDEAPELEWRTANEDDLVEDD